MEARVHCQPHIAEQQPVPDGQREITSCESHSAEAEGPRNGVATPSTLFSRRLSMRFPCILKPEKLLPWTALQKPQARRVHITTWIMTRPLDFWRRGIEQLPER